MRRIFAIFTLFALLGMTLAGCGAQVSAQEIVQKMRDTAASTNDAHIVVSGSAAITDAAALGVEGAEKLAGKNGELSLEIWLKKPNLIKIAVNSASAEGASGIVLQNDGQNFWAYDPSKKMAYKVAADAIRGLAGQANIPADLQDLVENPNLEDIIGRVLDMTDYKLLGEEKVGAWDTYKLELTPKSNSTAANAALSGVKGTIWVDKVTWAIVKADGAAPQGNASMSVSTLELNGGLPDSTFAFSLPDGGHVIDLSNAVPRSLTIDEARQQASAQGFTLLEPSYVPAGATLVQVMGSNGLMGKAGGYVLTYSGGASSPTFWISETKGGSAADMQKESGSENWSSKEVTVNGATAQLAGDKEGRMRVVFWQDVKSGISLAVGGQISESELLKIAEGLH